MPSIRSFRPEDVPEIDRIWKAHHSDNFGVPDRSTSIIDAVVEDDKGKVIAYGQVKLFAEAMLFLDLDASQRDKIQAVRLLMLEAFRGAELAKLNEIYALIQDPDFSLLIQKHFGFRAVDNPGELLKKEL